MQRTLYFTLFLAAQVLQSSAQEGDTEACVAKCYTDNGFTGPMCTGPDTPCQCALVQSPNFADFEACLQEGCPEALPVAQPTQCPDEATSTGAPSSTGSSPPTATPSDAPPDEDPDAPEEDPDAPEEDPDAPEEDPDAPEEDPDAPADPEEDPDAPEDTDAPTNGTNTETGDSPSPSDSGAMGSHVSMWTGFLALGVCIVLGGNIV